MGFWAWLKDVFATTEPPETAPAPEPLKPEPVEPPHKVTVDAGPVKVEVETKADFRVDFDPYPNKAAFYRVVRTKLGPLKQTQVEGFEHIFDKWKDAGLSDDRWLAYMFATAWHETAFTMQPVKEYGSSAYLMGKKYWPYIGRGYVQLTWKYNYERYGIAGTPDRALDPDFAAHIMIDGMTKGIFTSKKLGDYFNAKVNDPVGARRIINGTDKAQAIARYHDTFLQGLKAAKPEIDIRLS